MHQPGACPLENYSNDCSRVADLLKCKSTQLVSSVKSSVSLNFGYLCFFTSPKNDLSQLFLSHLSLCVSVYRCMWYLPWAILHGICKGCAYLANGSKFTSEENSSLVLSVDEISYGHKNTHFLQVKSVFKKWQKVH